jgi:uncharacterized membrane protein
MKMRIVYIIPTIIVLLLPVISLCFYPWLPEKMACHWSDGSQSDGCVEKWFYVFVMPLILLIIVSWLSILGIAFSGLNEAAGGFFAALSILLAMFLFYGHLLILLWNVGVIFDMSKLINLGIGIFIALIILNGIRFFSMRRFFWIRSGFPEDKNINKD